MEPKQRLDEISRGYQGAVVLLTAAGAGVFDAIGHGARGVGELSKELGLDEDALDRTLHALASLELLEKEGEAFRVNPEYAPFLLSDSPDTQANILKHQFSCLKRWARLEETLKTGEAPSAPMEERSDEDIRNFICGMADISRRSSREVAEKFDFSSYRRMLDLGGGPATSSIVIAQANPELRCVVFDLAKPIEIAKEQIAAAGMRDRIETRVGDYFKDDLGEGFDAVYVSNIIHSLGPDDTKMIFEKCHRALDGGGALIVKDFFLDDDRTSPVFGALFSINMLTGTVKGKSYTFTETEEILSGIGFGDFRRIPVAAHSALLVATKK